MLGYTQQAVLEVPPPDDRERAAPRRSRRLLRAGSTRAATPSLKSAWFNALRDSARHRRHARVARAGLEDRPRLVPGLTLAEPDYITLALELAVRERAGLAADPRRAVGADSRTRTARRSSSSSGRRCRPTPPTRDAFFASLRGREEPPPRGVGAPGGSATCIIRCAPPSAEKHLGPSLELLREIQRTGDIFFPKRWMDATLSGHQSASAARSGERVSGETTEGTIRSGCAASSCRRRTT